jgi:hypothetical protein
LPHWKPEAAQLSFALAGLTDSAALTALAFLSAPDL